MAAPATRATLADLARTPGKAELIGGRIIELMPTGIRPNEVAGNIYASLRSYVRTNRRGRAFTDNIGFTVPELTSGRESFSPDASYYSGPVQANLMRFVEGAPSFAVEVRSENDYSPSAETEITDKRADYFEAGTSVVWDVDPLAETVTCYRRGDPVHVVFHRGEEANAEPAVPGWRIAVDEVFESQQ
jgi:Uma2 family endonuclease